MKILIYTQVEIVPPLLLLLFSDNGGGQGEG